MSQDYIPLATVTLASTASSITFSNIPATYRDLVLIVNGKASTSTGVYVQLNSDGGNNYSQVRMYGFGSSQTGSDTQTSTSLDIGAITTAEGYMGRVNIMDYSATDKQKTFLNRNQESNLGAVLGAAGRWANTAAVNTVRVFTLAGTFAVGSTASLYGVIA